MSRDLFREKSEYKFPEPENTACFVCDHVMNRERSILFVSHDKVASNWQFLCGQSDHNDDSIRIISLKQVTEIDNTVNDLFEMPEGVCAERVKVGDQWISYKNEE